MGSSSTTTQFIIIIINVYHVFYLPQKDVLNFHAMNCCIVSFKKLCIKENIKKLSHQFYEIASSPFHVRFVYILSPSHDFVPSKLPIINEDFGQGF